jgi:hypothetical protein
MAISATYVVTPMFATSKVVVFFFACVTGETGFGDRFRRFVLERNDLCGIAFLDMRLPRPMTGFTAGNLVFPTPKTSELGVRGMGKRFELVFVTDFTSVAADIVRRLIIRAIRYRTNRL